LSRQQIFEDEEVAGIRGLTSLTEPEAKDGVGAIVDVPVIGARGDGKTQFIVHAIRTLRAYAPVLEGTEQEYNRDVLQVVLNAREPRPDATLPGVVPHYVFRIRPESLLNQVGFSGRLSLLARAAGLSTYLLLALLNASLLFAFLTWRAGAIGPSAIIASGVGLAVGAVLAWAFARRAFRGVGDLEIVFWDVAGEHIYSDSAADYYAFLSALVRERQKRARPSRTYSFAPILVCNPLSLGTKAEGSPYARLRQLIPLFSTLNGPNPRALVAINRFSVVQQLCRADSDRKESVALFAQRRNDDDDTPADNDESATTNRLQASEAMPIVVRDVVRAHCLDSEDGNDDGVHFSYLRYDAGIECEFVEDEWQGYEELPEAARLRWRAPTSAEPPQRTLEYRFEEGPGAFQGETRRDFLRWLSRLSYTDDHLVRRAPEPAPTAETSGDRTPRNPVAESPVEAAPDRAAARSTLVGRAESQQPQAPRAESEAPAPRDPDVSPWAPKDRAPLTSLSGAYDIRRPNEESHPIWSGPSADESSDEGTDPGLGSAQDQSSAGGFRGGT
jgi:hypothetical protein